MGLDYNINSYKIESKLELIKISSLDYFNNPKTIKVYSPVIIVDKRLK